MGRVHMAVSESIAEPTLDYVEQWIGGAILNEHTYT